MKKFTLHWSLHPDKDEAWYKNEINTKMMTEDEVARELDISYALSVSGKVFSSFRPDRHVSTEEIPVIKNYPVYRIWDFGKVNATLYGQIDAYGRRRLLHERVLGAPDNPSGFTEQLRVAQVDSARLFPGCTFMDICDPAGSFEDHRGTSTEVEQLNRIGIYPEYRTIIELPTRERKRRGIKLIQKDMQETPGGKEAFQIYVSPSGEHGCSITKKSLASGYAYKKDANGNITDVIDEKHPYEDVIDCLIYWYLESYGTEDYAISNDDLRSFKVGRADDYYDPVLGM